MSKETPRLKSCFILFSMVFLDAIASVGLHMSVCLSVSGFDDGISVMEILLVNGAMMNIMPNERT